jgi:hypothetical protein
MKRGIPAAGLAASVSLTLTGRGDKDSGGHARPDNPHAGGSRDGALVGKWYTRFDAALHLEDQLEYEFRSDGTFLCMGMEGFTFSASEGVITIALWGRMKAGSAKYKISGKTLTLFNGGGYYLTNGMYYQKEA